MSHNAESRYELGSASINASQLSSVFAYKSQPRPYQPRDLQKAQPATLSLLAEQLGEIEAKLEDAQRRRSWVERENIQLRTSINGRSMSPELVKKAKLTEILRQHNKDLQSELADLRQPHLSPARLATVLERQNDLILKLGAANERLARQVKQVKGSNL